MRRRCEGLVQVDSAGGFGGAIEGLDDVIEVLRGGGLRVAVGELDEAAGPGEEPLDVVVIGVGLLGDVGIVKGVEMTFENAVGKGVVLEMVSKALEVEEV